MILSNPGHGPLGLLEFVCDLILGTVFLVIQPGYPRLSRAWPSLPPGMTRSKALRRSANGQRIMRRVDVLNLK